MYSVQKFDQSRHLAKTKLHPEYPHRKKMNPALKQDISVFANRNTQKNMQLLDKIDTVFTAALTFLTSGSVRYIRTPRKL